MPACQTCELRCSPLFSPLSAEEVAFMIDFREGEVQLKPGEILFQEGDALSHFYTVWSGQGSRYKTLENGERQTVNFVFPGDVIGLSGTLIGDAGATMQAASAMRLCRFRKHRLPELFRDSYERAYALTWIAAAEEHFLGEIIATLGRRDALQRMAWALFRIHQRLSLVGLRDADGRVPFPFRQAALADALGLSLVHTNKTLARLRGLARVGQGWLKVIDEAALARLGLTDSASPPQRPLL
jgi:CRP/FNR family transcriptional regulator, anaerobic regulatory protein